MIHAPIARTFATANVVYRRPLAEIDDGREYIPSPDMYDHPPRHGRGLPAQTFRVVYACGLDSVHIGHGLTIDDVVFEETRHCLDPSDTEPDLMNASDRALFQDNRVVAILRDLHDGQGGYKLLRVDAVWTPVGELVPDPDGDDPDWVAHGYAAAEAARLATLHKYPPAWTITSAGETLFLTRADRSLEEVVVEAMIGFDSDLTIWRGSELAATIRLGADGSPEVVRFDALETTSV